MKKENEQLFEQLQAERMALETSLDDETERLLMESRLDLTKDIPDPEVLISRDGCPVCTRGNLSMVIGLPGARKSFLCVGIVGALLSQVGCIGLSRSSPNLVILWIDTEQADGHVARIGRRLNRIAGIDERVNNPNVAIHKLREFSPENRNAIFLRCVKKYHPDFVVIDGIADFISDTNDAASSNDIIGELMRVSKDNNLHILLVVHANIGSEKARGHLGSESLRKCETAISVKADGDVSICSFSKTRDMRPSDFVFTIKDGLPYGATAPMKKDMSLVSEFSAVLGSPLTYTDLKAAIMKYKGVSGATAERHIAKGAAQFIIDKKGEMYMLAPAMEKEGEILPF